MKELFLADIPQGNSTLVFRIYTALQENPNHILSKGLYKMVRDSENNNRYKASVLGLHIKRTTIRIKRENNPYSCGGSDCIHTFHY